MANKKGEITSGKLNSGTSKDKLSDTSLAKKDSAASKVKAAKERRWPSSAPAKKGSLAGHCMNND